MRGTRQRWLQRAVGAIAWLLLLCAASACAGPGLEPPAERSEGSRDAGDEPGSGAHGGAGGSSGSGGPPLIDPGGGDGDGDSAGDAGEASQDAGVDEDGGSDPEELER